MKTENTPTSKPWVSFCMTTRRRPDMLLKTLRSIQWQTVREFEVIVSDNDTAGSGRAVVESLRDDRFQYYCNEEDLGMIASFNRSLSKAAGEFVVMITDDDPLYPEMLETVKGLAEKHPNYGAYYGGCDILQANPLIAKMTLHKVGTNSCLAQIPLDSIRTYTRERFPHAFFEGELDSYPLWSVGIVRREIAQEVRVPSYGTPFLGDYAYVASVGSVAGCVLINRSLGCQTMHDSNFGRLECSELKTAVTGFTGYIAKRFSNRPDYPELKPKVEKFIGQWVVMHSLFLNQFFRDFKIKNHDLNAVLKELFKIPYLKRVRLYYILGLVFIRFQRFQVDIRTSVFRKMRKSK